VLWRGLLPTASGEQIIGLVSLVMRIKYAFRMPSRIASR
jgi:hypothetical protein